MKKLLFCLLTLLPAPLFAGIPLTDLIFYGRVYQKTQAPVTGVLPGPVTVKITPAAGSQIEPTIIASTVELLDAGSGTKEFYVLRIKRFEAGSSRAVGDNFVRPGDRIHVYLNGVQVTETEVPSVLATDAVQDIRLLGLNAPPTAPDTDGDGLPDSWEQQYFGTLTAGANEDSNKDGVTNFMALFGGLNPNQNNASMMPVLQREQNGALVFFFRQASSPTGLSYTLQASETLAAVAAWQPLSGITPLQVSDDGTSKLIKVTIPGGVDRAQRFFRLSVIP